MKFILHNFYIEQQTSPIRQLKITYCTYNLDNNQSTKLHCMHPIIIYFSIISLKNIMKFKNDFYDRELLFIITLRINCLYFKLKIFFSYRCCILCHSDEKLMLKYQNGDISSFELLYDKHKGGVYRFFLRQVNQQSIAEELHQETWMKIINSRKQYIPTAQFNTYLYRIAHNLLIDYFRKSSTKTYNLFISDQESICDYADTDEYNPENIESRRSDAEKLTNYINQLSPPQKEVFLLRIDSGLTVSDIAKTIGIKHEAAKSRLRYAMTRIASMFEEDAQ